MIDLSRLPPPDVVEPLDFESILAERKARLLELTPDAERAAVAAALELESEPITKLLQETAYREMILRQRINDAAHACMLPWAKQADLDNLAALYGVSRLELVAADASTIPPAPAVMESDEDLRRRVQLAPEGLSVAGSRGAYLFHSLSADARVKDAHIGNPEPGVVRVAVLARDGDGSAPPDLLGIVHAALSAETVRPLCDSVSVVSAGIVEFAVQAVLTVQPGPSPAVVLETALRALDAELGRLAMCGQQVARSAIYAALHQPGVEHVALAQPAADIIVNADQAAHCTNVSVSVAEP